MLLDILASSVIAGLVGGLLCLDRTAAFQVMASRPLVSAPVMGLLLGEPATGLAAGVLIELLYMADRPVGSYMPAHETGLAIVVTAVSAAFLKGSPSVVLFSGAPPSLMGIGGPLRVVVPVMLVSIPVAFFYRGADNFTRRINERLFLNARRALDEEGARSHLIRENLKGLFNFFWPTAVFIFVTVFILSFAVRLLAPFIAVQNVSALYPAVIGALILGISMALNAVKVRGSLIVFSLSGILAAFIWTMLR